MLERSGPSLPPAPPIAAVLAVDHLALGRVGAFLDGRDHRVDFRGVIAGAGLGSREGRERLDEGLAAATHAAGGLQGGRIGVGAQVRGELLGETSREGRVREEFLPGAHGVILLQLREDAGQDLERLGRGVYGQTEQGAAAHVQGLGFRGQRLERGDRGGLADIT